MERFPEIKSGNEHVKRPSFPYLRKNIKNALEQDASRTNKRKRGGKKRGSKCRRVSRSNTARERAYLPVAPRGQLRARPSQQWRKPSHPIRIQ